MTKATKLYLWLPLIAGLVIGAITGDDTWAKVASAYGVGAACGIVACTYELRRARRKP